MAQRQHILRDLQLYVCTFPGCELYESLISKRDEWFQHESQSHRIEWKCGEGDHGQYTDQVSFLHHMKTLHNLNIDTAQSAVFLGMFESREYKQTGTCCLCLREAKNLKTHLAHHLEQIALFALPRENEVPEMNSGVNVRGSSGASSETATHYSGSELAESSDEVAWDGKEDAEILDMQYRDENEDLDEQKVILELTSSDLAFSWSEVYQEMGHFDNEDDQKKLRAFATNSMTSSEPQRETLLAPQESQREGIRRWLSAPDPCLNYQAALRRVCAGTGEWFFETNAYMDWLSKPGSFLWLHGILGCGKTTLSSIIIQRTIKHCQARFRSVTLYFYFDHHDVEKQHQKNMMRSLISQLIGTNVDTRYVPHMDMPYVLECLYLSCSNGQGQPAYESLLMALREMLSSFDQIYLVLDALDECLERTELLATIEKLTTWHDMNFHILVTSRRGRDIEDLLEPLIQNGGKVCIDGTSVNEDIRTYIQCRLRTDPHLKRWQRRPEVQQEIEDMLMKGDVM